MASANNRVDAFALLAPVVLPVTLGGAGYAAWKVNWKQAVKAFLTGPGRTSRIILLLFVVFNRKNMPFMWTVSLAPSQAKTPLEKTDLYRSPSTGSSTASCATTSSARRRSSARARSSSPSSARRTRRSSRSTTTCTSPTRPSSPTSTSRARTSSRTCSARRCAT